MTRSSFQFFLLQLAAVLVFWGRAWQHLVHEPPYRAFFTGEALECVRYGVGGLYGACAVAALLVREGGGAAYPRVLRGALWTGAVALTGLACLYCLEHNGRVGQLIEYASQVGCVVFVILLSKERATSGAGPRLVLRMMCVAVALTFLGHGLYAVGYYETPKSFVDMLSRGLGLSHPLSKSVLLVAGLLDFWVATALVWAAASWDADDKRNATWFHATLAYAAVWGFATALARVVTITRIELFWETFSIGHFETMVRLVHGLLPLAILLSVRGCGHAAVQNIGRRPIADVPIGR
jgi:hypothetical protein